MHGWNGDGFIMNSKKYKDTIYETRDINNIKELFVGSCDLYAHKTAYLVKEKPGGKYMPIKYIQIYYSIKRRKNAKNFRYLLL